MSYKYTKIVTEETMLKENGTNTLTVTYSEEYKDLDKECIDKNLKGDDKESDIEFVSDIEEDDLNSISDKAALKLNIKIILKILFSIGLLSIICYNYTHIMDNMVVYLFIIGIYVISKLCRVVYKFITNLKIKVE